MIVAELRIVPVGDSSSMGEVIAEATAAIRAHGVKHKVGPLGTTLEAERLDDILDAVKAAHSAAIGIAPRVLTELTLDQRTDKEETARTLTKVRKA
ncbi:MAG: MTH1187 family thiamine-binding protein [Euryarchaeota archaeon]|nr:MTH1187 family thiamine-binding protein [Euryarchaeota archaeon]